MSNAAQLRISINDDMECPAYFFSFSLRPQFRRCFALGAGGFLGGSVNSAVSRVSADVLLIWPSTYRMGLRKWASNMPVA